MWEGYGERYVGAILLHSSALLNPAHGDVRHLPSLLTITCNFVSLHKNKKTEICKLVLNFRLLCVSILPINSDSNCFRHSLMTLQFETLMTKLIPHTIKCVCFAFIIYPLNVTKCHHFVPCWATISHCWATRLPSLVAHWATTFQSNLVSPALRINILFFTILRLSTYRLLATMHYYSWADLEGSPWVRDSQKSWQTPGIHLTTSPAVSQIFTDRFMQI